MSDAADSPTAARQLAIYATHAPNNSLHQTSRGRISSQVTLISAACW
jgi:hypothetical protein